MTLSLSWVIAHALWLKINLKSWDFGFTVGKVKLISTQYKQRFVNVPPPLHLDVKLRVGIRLRLPWRSMVCNANLLSWPAKSGGANPLLTHRWCFHIHMGIMSITRQLVMPMNLASIGCTRRRSRDAHSLRKRLYCGHAVWVPVKDDSW